MTRIAVILMLLFAPLKALATDLDIIVARGEGIIELFVSTRADNFVHVFDLDPLLLAEPDGTVDFDNLRFGTFDTADVLFTDVSAEVGGAPAILEAMSMMVHPIADKLPFETPIDGLVSIAVCSVPTPATPPTLEQLWGYAGFITYVDDASGPLSLRLPDDAPAVEVRIRDFTFAGEMSDQTLRLSGGEAFTLTLPETVPGKVSVPLVLMALGVAALASLTLLRRRLRPALAKARTAW